MMYAYIKGDADGQALSILPQQDLEEFLADPRSYASIERFEDKEFLTLHPDPNYWAEGTAVLLKIEVVQPRPVTKTWSIE